MSQTTPDAIKRQDFSLRGRRVWVAGHRGMVGSAIVRRLANEGCEVLTASRQDADLRDPQGTLRWMKAKAPDVVFVAAAKVGGILENSRRPAEFIFDNLAIETSIIGAAQEIGVKKLLFLGSSCVYPKMAAQPIAEEALLSGPLEPTNDWYAIAKIAGLKLCQAYRRQYGSSFISCMPTNLYGPHDNFDLQSSHVLPALLRKIHEAKLAGAQEVPIWGSGQPRREFLHVDDLADACVFLMRNFDGDLPLNVGTGSDIAIAELAALIAEVVGYRGSFAYDRSKPDGTPRKLLDVSRLSELGWRAKIDLRDGIAATYRWYLDSAKAA